MSEEEGIMWSMYARINRKDAENQDDWIPIMCKHYLSQEGYKHEISRIYELNGFLSQWEVFGILIDFRKGQVSFYENGEVQVPKDRNPTIVLYIKKLKDD